MMTTMQVLVIISNKGETYISLMLYAPSKAPCSISTILFLLMSRVAKLGSLVKRSLLLLSSDHDDYDHEFYQKPVEKTKSTDSGDLVVGQDQVCCCRWDARWNFLAEEGSLIELLNLEFNFENSQSDVVL